MAERRRPRKNAVAPSAADEPRRPLSAEELRRQAEDHLDGLSAAASAAVAAAAPAPEELVAAVHELRVHQIELEMQNEELRRAQLELEEQREKYFELFHLAPVGYFTLIDKGIVGEANHTAALMLGVDRQQLVGQPFSVFVFTADRDAYYLFLRALEKTRAPQSCELRLQPVGAEPLWVHLEGRPQSAADGEPPRHHVTFTDVHERVLAEEALRESEAKYREVVERATDGIAVLQGGRVIFANEALARMSGYSVGELAGMPFRDGAEEGRREIEERVRRRLAGEDVPANDEIVLVRKDGTPFTVEMSAGIISYEGAPGELVLLRDVTERKRAEEELREARDFVENLISHASAPIIVWDAEQRIVRFNHAFEELSGLAAEEVVGQHLSLLFPGDERRAQAIDLAALLAAGESLPVVEIPIVRPDGEVRAVLWTSSILCADDGVTPLATIAQGQDVSERKRAEEALRESEERHRAMFEKNRAVKLVIDPETAAIVDASPAACEFYGYTRDELLARRITDINALPAATVREEMARAAGEHVTNFAFRHRLASGELRDVEVNSGPFETGGRTLLFCIVHDVTERKQAEHLLEGRVKELRALYGLADIAEGSGLTLDGLYQELANNLPASWQYADVAGARTVLGEREFLSEGFTETAWMQSAPVRVRGSAAGRIEVAYREAMPDEDEGPFLKEERRLIDALAERLGRITERRQAEAELLRLNDELVAEAAALEEANATIMRIAATDHLTGLSNRRHFYESLEHAVSLARRHGSPLALVSLDLDGLKRVNDSAGHEAGDEVLTSFAALLAALCRAEDLPARLGGDEFCVLLPGMDQRGAQGFAERVLATVRACDALAQRRVTVSGGVAQWTPNELPDDLLRRADEALYAAKREGGDGVAVGD